MFKKLSITLTLFLSIYILFQLFLMRFVFSFPSPLHSCLDASLFIIDKWDKEYSKGDIMAFEFQRDGDMVFGDRKMQFIKRVAAKGGDLVRVTPTAVSVNDEAPVELSMILSAHALKVKASEYQREIEVPSNSFFALGETLNSYDSRYWGTVENSKIIGKAYAIF